MAQLNIHISFAHQIFLQRCILAAMDSVAGEEGARIAEETQLDNPDNRWQLWRKISDEYQPKDQTILLYTLVMFGRTPRYCKAMIVFRFPGCIFSVSTAAIEVEQSTPAFKTARTLARMLSKKRLIERHITCYQISSCSILSQYIIFIRWLPRLVPFCTSFQPCEAAPRQCAEQDARALSGWNRGGTAFCPSIWSNATIY